MDINPGVSVEFVYARFAYNIIHTLRMTAMIELMAQIGVRPSIHEFSQRCSMSGRAKAKPSMSHGSSEPSIPESNDSTSMLPLILCIFTNVRGDVYARLAIPVDATQEMDPGEPDDTTALFYTRFPHLGDVVLHPVFL